MVKSTIALMLRIAPVKIVEGFYRAAKKEPSRVLKTTSVKGSFTIRTSILVAVLSNST